MKVFVDTSVWFAATVANDYHNAQAKALLRAMTSPITTDHVLVESWSLIARRNDFQAAERFLTRALRSGLEVIVVGRDDLARAIELGSAFSDQRFSIIDRTCFVVMERLGITKAASFDNDFAIYRYGPDRRNAFEIVR